ncbi:MAG: Rhomboid family protein, partial [Verrucomicrobia bacterium]|nr:Rhomboid family protein [Verrucomicrobiota bacterium]
MGVFAVVVFFSDALRRVLIFDRTAILHGAAWRVWTGNVVHFGPSHLLWNLAVFVPAGIWLERITPRAARCLLALSPALVGATMLVFQPTLDRYAGLSGVAAGVLALLAFTQLTRPRGDHWFWWSVLVLLAL